jgi:hypothetical protein
MTIVRNYKAISFCQGVLITIQGLPPAQLKNVMFVFIPLESDGMFEIAARFMGVDMERVIIDIQVCRQFAVPLTYLMYDLLIAV